MPSIRTPRRECCASAAVIGREGMIAFADELAVSAAQHRAAFLADVEALHPAARMAARPRSAPRGFAHVPAAPQRTDAVSPSCRASAAATMLRVGWDAPEARWPGWRVPDRSSHSSRPPEPAAFAPTPPMTVSTRRAARRASWRCAAGPSRRAWRARPGRSPAGSRIRVSSLRPFSSRTPTLPRSSSPRLGPIPARRASIRPTVQRACRARTRPAQVGVYAPCAAPKVEPAPVEPIAEPDSPS
jgi:hypothetical protein